MLHFKNLRWWSPLWATANAAGYFSFICYLWADTLFPAISLERKVLEWLYAPANQISGLGEDSAGSRCSYFSATASYTR